MRGRIETIDIIVKFYRALVIHHHWVCANHEENVKEKHRIDIERQKAKIHELASSQVMVQSTHFHQHADDVKGKRDAIAATCISHRSPTATSANHRKERQNQFEQFFQYAPQCCLLVPKSCPACTSSSSTPIAETEEQRLDLFKSLLESATYHLTLKSNDANSSQDVIRRNAELLHEGFKLLIMLTYPTKLWQSFWNATKLKNRALRRLRDLKATEDFMAVQLQCRFRYLKQFKTIVDGLANNNKKKKKNKSSKLDKPVKLDARVQARVEMDEFVASFDRQKLEALRVFWTETLDLAKRDRKRLVRKVVLENRKLPVGHWEAGEDPFWAQVIRLRELLQTVKSESDGEVGVRRAGRSLGSKVLEHAVERCRFDWRRELAGVGMEASDGDEDEDEEWEDVDEWREMEEVDGEVDGEEVDGDEEPEIVGKGKGKENEKPHDKL
ncbi:MAG: hypothetical protein LQ349_009298 [Xanthoria aureola]|nr:MAG: hypothetical protein LQ349_009298 [Xanthoria aureola]